MPLSFLVSLLLAAAAQGGSAQPPAAGQQAAARAAAANDDAHAGRDGPPAPTMVATPMAMAIAGFDTDGDGRTSRAELTAGIARSFARFDTGHRGKLRLLDYADWALAYLGDRNALPSPLELDTDGDDAVSLAELQAGFAAAFDRLDRDHDGYVTRAELLTIREGRGPDDGARRGGKRHSR